MYLYKNYKSIALHCLLHFALFSLFYFFLTLSLILQDSVLVTIFIRAIVTYAN